MEAEGMARHYDHADRGVSCPFPAYHRAQAVRLSGHPGTGLNPLTKLDYGPLSYQLRYVFKDLLGASTILLTCLIKVNAMPNVE